VALGAVALALAAAFLHALWNLLIARAADSQAATAVASVAGVVAFTVPALALWEVDGSAWPYVAASAVLEVAYFATLAGAYGRGELSVVYPLARGTAPLLVLLVSVAALGAATSAAQALGVVVLAAGVLLVRGLRRPDDPAAVALAFACGACIAGYTLVDAEGLEHADPLPYLWLTLGIASLAYLPAVARARGGAALRRALRGDVLLAGVLMVGAYGLVLAALRLADPGPVAALRETSVVIATALGALALRERVTGARAAGAGLVVAGAALIALS
jgi:drug/metabolite transporter (DMT)-like permease